MKLLIAAVALTLLVAVLGPVFNRAYENRRRNETALQRYRAFFNARFTRVQKRGKGAILTPTKDGWSGYHHPHYGWVAKVQPLLVTKGMKLHQIRANGAPLFVVQDITTDGVVIRGGHTKPFTLAWK